jgi:hypothetical protein
MPFAFSDITQLANYVRSLKAALGEDADDIAQEALARAVARGEAPDLIAAAKLEVPALLEERRLNHLRGQRVSSADPASTDEADASAFGPLRQSRSRAPHLPKGLTRWNREGGESRYLPSETGDPPTDAEVTMAARLLRDFVEPVLRREPVPPEHRAQLAEVYEAFFGGPVDHVWAEVLVEEIGEAAREKLTVLTQENPPGDLGATDVVVRMERKPAALERDPTTPRVVEQKVTTRVRRLGGDRVMIELVGELFGEEKVLAYAIGTFAEHGVADTPSWTGPTRASFALLRAIERNSALPNARALPDWVLDAELVDFLVERMGFEGGGGPKKLSGRRLVELLTDRTALAAEIESFGERIAERSTDEVAARWSERCRALAQRVRDG